MWSGVSLSFVTLGFNVPYCTSSCFRKLIIGNSSRTLEFSDLSSFSLFLFFPYFCHYSIMLVLHTCIYMSVFFVWFLLSLYTYMFFTTLQPFYYYVYLYFQMTNRTTPQSRVSCQFFLFWDGTYYSHYLCLVFWGIILLRSFSLSLSEDSTLRSLSVESRRFFVRVYRSFLSVKRS